MPWYKDAFDETYLLTTARTLSEEETRWEVDGILTLLGLPAKGGRQISVLDVPCAHGRHSIELSRRGHQATGVDLSPIQLQEAAHRAEAAGVDVRWVQMDMRELPFEGEFDVALNLFNSFGYLEDEDEDARCLAAISRALRPGGRLVMDIVNKYWYIEAGTERTWSGESGAFSLEDAYFDVLTDRVEIERILVIGGKEVRKRASIRLYSYVELKGMLEHAGLSVLGVYGGLHGEALTLASPRLVVVASTALPNGGR